MISLIELLVVGGLIAIIVIAVKVDKKIQNSGKDFPINVKRLYK